MKKLLGTTAILAIMAIAIPAGATSANGSRSGTSFGAGTPRSAASGGVSADGSAAGNSFGSTTIGTDRINSDDDSDGVPDTQDTAPKDNTTGGLNDVDTDHDGISDASDPTPTINDGDTPVSPATATNSQATPTTPSTADQNVDGMTNTDGDIGTTGDTQSQPGVGEPDFSLHTATDLPNPNNPDPRLNNGTTADDAEARMDAATKGNQ